MCLHRGLLQVQVGFDIVANVLNTSQDTKKNKYLYYMKTLTLEQIREVVATELEIIFEKEVIQEKKRKKRKKKSKQLKNPSGRFFYPVFGGFGMYGDGGSTVDSGGDSGGGDGGGE